MGKPRLRVGVELAKLSDGQKAYLTAGKALSLVSSDSTETLQVESINAVSLILASLQANRGYMQCLKWKVRSTRNVAPSQSSRVQQHADARSSLSHPLVLQMSYRTLLICSLPWKLFLVACDRSPCVEVRSGQYRLDKLFKTVISLEIGASPLFVGCDGPHLQQPVSSTNSLCDW